jgi:peptidoglycan/LPS O-acetylase OafA/YrhL
MSVLLRPSLRVLTGVRFLAALHVVAFHYARVLGQPWMVRVGETKARSRLLIS